MGGELNTHRPRFFVQTTVRILVSANFEELDYAETPLGELILRKRRLLAIDQEVYEVKLDDSFLMSSLVNVSEIALAEKCLVRLTDRTIDVAVGGLGLGYTAQAALKNRNVKSLIVVEYLSEVIGWHTRNLVPAAESLITDPRCRFVNGDFFALAGNPELGLDLESVGRRFDAILLDIDHTPDYVLDASHASFYEPEGFTLLSQHLNPEGVFGLWSAGAPDERILASLAECFESADAEVISFKNPLLNIEDRNTIYVAHLPSSQRSQ